MSEREMSPQEIAELRRLARSRPRSGRGQVAKLGAIRTLERLDRETGRRREREVPPCPPDWHPYPGSVLEDLDRVYLERHPVVRERMWRQHVTTGAFAPIDSGE